MVVTTWMRKRFASIRRLLARVEFLGRARLLARGMRPFERLEHDARALALEPMRAARVTWLDVVRFMLYNRVTPGMWISKKYSIKVEKEFDASGTGYPETRRRVYDDERYSSMLNGLRILYAMMVLATLLGVALNLVQSAWASQPLFASMLIASGIGALFAVARAHFCVRRSLEARLGPEEKIRRELAKSMAPAVERLMEHRLAQLREQLLGEESRYRSVAARLEGRRHEANVLLERAQVRVRGQEDAPEYLQSAVSRAQAVCDRYDQALDRLRQFGARVEACLTECADHARQLTAHVRDLELLRAIGEMEVHVGRDEADARAVAQGVWDALQDGMESLRLDVERRGELAQQFVRELPDTGRALDDLDALERVIDEFVPARVSSA